MKYYIEVRDNNYKEIFYLSYIDNSYYCLNKNNFNKAYKSFEYLVSFEDYKLAEDFLIELTDSISRYKLYKTDDNFIRKLSFMILNRSLIYKIIAENEL